MYEGTVAPQSFAHQMRTAKLNNGLSPWPRNALSETCAYLNNLYQLFTKKDRKFCLPATFIRKVLEVLLFQTDGGSQLNE